MIICLSTNELLQEYPVLTQDSLLCSKIYHMLIFILVPNMKKHVLPSVAAY